jgi:hypothetical protein
MDTLKISSTLETVLERQRAYGVYEPEQFIRSPQMTAYWSGHLIEELCEFESAFCEDKPSEAADVFIFLQNLTAYLYPKEELVITFKDPTDYPWYGYSWQNLSELILELRLALSDRKSWKSYKQMTFESWETEVVESTTSYIFSNCNYEKAYQAYLSKTEYNKNREDWSRDPGL